MQQPGFRHTSPYSPIKPKVVGYGGELVEGGLEVLGDLFGDHVRLGEASGVLQAFVPQPEEVEDDLVAFEYLLKRRVCFSPERN